jgi:hypothetical protein
MARWHSCNVLQVGVEARHLWQFDARNSAFALRREQTVPAAEPMPEKLTGKSWSSLWQRKLNVAWLPPEDVFIRVAHLPGSTPEEVRAMVELQLEKLSPIPVTQVVWTMQLLSQSTGPMQTVVVIIAARSSVEEFLGGLESQGYLADRLELALLDQLQATTINGEGAWIYAEAGRNAALVAWWYGGALQNLDLLHLSTSGERATGLKDQLMQMAWAGELEGWLTGPPSWHLVTDAATARQWEQLLRQGLDQAVEVIEPLTGTELAARTAGRATQADPKNNLLPAEFTARYRQKFVDRLWMRGLLAALTLYGVGCVIYFVAVAVLNYFTSQKEDQVAGLSLTYTNALQSIARYGVLRDRQDLKFAALDCWRATAEYMPEGLTLDSMNFNDGKTMSLAGTVPSQQLISASDFSGKLSRATVTSGPHAGQPLFNSELSDPFQSHVNPGNATASWSFSLELKRGEEP